MTSLQTALRSDPKKKSKPNSKLQQLWQKLKNIKKEIKT